jgi:hypothetical protein
VSQMEMKIVCLLLILPRMVVPHALGWIAVVVVLWVLAPHASAKDVFTNFSSNGGWEPIGLSLMVGQITSVYFLICSSIFKPFGIVLY